MGRTCEELYIHTQVVPTPLRSPMHHTKMARNMYYCFKLKFSVQVYCIPLLIGLPNSILHFICKRGGGLIYRQEPHQYPPQYNNIPNYPRQSEVKIGGGLMPIIEGIRYMQGCVLKGGQFISPTVAYLLTETRVTLI